MSPAEARQHLSTGIAEMMYGLSRLAHAGPDAFEAQRAELVSALDALRGVLRTCANDLQLEDPRFGAALPHVTALIEALGTVTPDAPLSGDIERSFERFLAAAGTRPSPSLRELISAYRTTMP